jgi:hypothetical protein
MGEALKRHEPSLYETDFYAWTQDQGAKLRARAGFDNRGDIDWENAAEEIESMGRRERREIASRLSLVLVHLLKWQFQPTHRSRSWRGTIKEQRRMLQQLLDDNPSLASLPADILVEEYSAAVAKASGETGFAQSTFPATCPFHVPDILNHDFLPEDE